MYFFIFPSQLQVEGLTKSKLSPRLITSLRDDTSMGWIQWEYMALNMHLQVNVQSLLGAKLNGLK